MNQGIYVWMDVGLSYLMYVGDRWGNMYVGMYRYLRKVSLTRVYWVTKRRSITIKDKNSSNEQYNFSIWADRR